MKKRVVVGLSGGVDSSVAAYLLKKQGYDVVGMFMKNWHNETENADIAECPWLQDSTDALVVSQQLSIPFQGVDLSKAYKERIVDYMFAEYEGGRTPNPDICCNREIKFSAFLDVALSLGADFIATGHYCRKQTITKNGQKTYRLLAGKDKDKDQSYFLCQLTQQQLEKALFPIGELTKKEVRAVAKKLNLITAHKKDSQGLCFVGKIHLPTFLQQRLKPKHGKIIAVPADAPAFKKKYTDNLAVVTQPYALNEEDGKIVGEHQGAYYYTIGQRKGLHKGGTPEPLFVIGIDTDNNIVYMGQGKSHPGLYRKGLFIAHAREHWVRPDLKLQQNESKKYLARIRYRQPLASCRLTKKQEGIYVVFDEPQCGIAKGQFAAWYVGDELIGSGVIH